MPRASDKIPAENRTNALIPQLDGRLSFNRFSITPIGAAIPEDITEIELETLINLYQQVEASIQWVVGDLANRLKTFKGDGVYEDLAIRFDKSPKTIREWAYVCDNVSLSIRMDKPMTFKHHQVIAPLTIEDQRRWLEYAFLNQLSAEQLKEQIRRELGQSDKSAPKTFLERITHEFQAHQKQIQSLSKEERAEFRGLLINLIAHIDALEKPAIKLPKPSATPRLREWYGDPLKPPKIRTVKSLRGRISDKKFSSISWIAKIRPQDNVIIDAYQLKTWHFAEDGHLVGKVKTPGWEKDVEIALNEYVILHVK